LNQRNSTVAVLKHGEKVGIVDMRRRYAKVRSARGVEGWLDALELLGPQDMLRIQRERGAARSLPSEGIATAYETLNIHLDPNRKSPAFTQIPEGGAVEILGRRIAPKLAPPPRSTLTFEHAVPVTRKPRKQRAATKNVLKQPPKPPAPKPPGNWQRTWGVDTEAETPEPQASDKGKQPEKPVVMESWLLVRTKNGQTGWALARNLMMAIPDEVAQYAAGRHITSYFDLGAINDERDGEKHNWLWTTASAMQAADFDAWRVFLWNRRRHRYETSYRQHDIEGYFPVHVDPPDPTRFGRTFQLIMKDDDNKLRKRTYLFDGTRVHLIATEDYRPEAANAAQTSAAAKPNQGWLQREWNKVKGALKRH
jgi:hypothetical protein